MSATPPPLETALRNWPALCLLVGLLLGHAATTSVTREQPPEAFWEIGVFRADNAKGILVVPPGAPDWQTPHVSALHDALGPDGRAGLSTDESLGAGVAVLKIKAFEADSLNALLDALARHPRVAGQPRCLPGFGAGAQMAAEWSGPDAQRRGSQSTTAGAVAFRRRRRELLRGEPAGRSAVRCCLADPRGLTRHTRPIRAPTVRHDAMGTRHAA